MLYATLSASTRNIHAGFKAWTRNQSHPNRWLFSFVVGEILTIAFLPNFPCGSSQSINSQVTIALRTARVFVPKHSPDRKKINSRINQLTSRTVT